MNRSEEAADLSDDPPPELPDGLDMQGVQTERDGTGPLFHRIYRARSTMRSSRPPR